MDPLADEFEEFLVLHGEGLLLVIRLPLEHRMVRLWLRLGKAPGRALHEGCLDVEVVVLRAVR